MPLHAVRWAPPRSGESRGGENRVAHSQQFHNWRSERNQVEEVRYVRGAAVTIPRSTKEPCWNLKPAPNAPQVPDRPRPSSAPSTPRRTIHCSGPVGSCEHEGIHATDTPVSRANQKTFTAQVERLRSGGVRMMYPKPEPGKGKIIPTVPSHVASPRPGRPPHTRPASARGSRKSEVSREKDPKTQACLKLLMHHPAAFCILILCGSRDIKARTDTLRAAVKEAYPQAPVGVSPGGLRPGAIEVIFFSSCDFSSTTIWVSPARTLRKGVASLTDGPEPDELIRLISEQCASLALKLEESKKRLESVIGK